MSLNRLAWGKMSVLVALNAFNCGWYNVGKIDIIYACWLLIGAIFTHTRSKLTGGRMHVLRLFFHSVSVAASVSLTGPV